MIDKWSDFFPFVHVDDFDSSIKEKIEIYSEKIHNKFYNDELRRFSSKNRRSKQEIKQHCKYGIIKEVSFAIINGLDPISHVDFNINKEVDRYDIKIDDLYIDITSSDIIQFNKYSDFVFDIIFSISERKYESIIHRLRGDFYLAKEIALLKQENNKVYYFGQIELKSLVSKKHVFAKRNNKKIYCFFAQGKKINRNSNLSNEILLA